MPLPRTLFWNNLALDLLAIGRTGGGERLPGAALAGSEDAGLMELLGLTYSHQGLTDQAERCWRQAERWDPKNADVCLDLGRLALGRRRWDEAVGFLKRAADRSREAVEPLYNLSQAYRMLGNHDEAERYRRLADERRRSQPPRSAGMGADVDARRTGRRWASAATRGVAAMTIARPRPREIGLALRTGRARGGRRGPDPAGAPCRAPRAWTGLEPLLAARRFDEAERRIGEYLRVHPDQTPGQHADGAGRPGAGRSEAATGPRAPRADQGPQRRGIRAIVLLNEGKAYSALGRNDRAEAAWKDALRLDPRVPEAGWALLGLYYIQGRRAEAHRLGLELHAIEPDPRDRVQLLAGAGAAGCPDARL